MHRTQVNVFLKTNLKKAMLMSILTVLILNLGLMVETQTVTPATSTTNALAKISPTLLEKIDAHKHVPLNVLVETRTNDYSSIIAEIEAFGGKVTHQYKYVKALAASVPADKVLQLARNKDVLRIYYDVERTLFSSLGASLGTSRFDSEFDPVAGVPIPLKDRGYEVISISSEQLESLEPCTYWNPTAMNATPVWDEGYWGRGSLVVIIDTGIWTGHFMFAGTNITGGIDLSFDVGTEYEGWDKETNHYHGSHVAGILASTGGIILPEDDPLVIAIEEYTGETLPEFEPGYKLLWVLGMAPEAALYIIKVFDHTGGGVPESKILESLEYVIDLTNQGIDVDVVSMSLGGPTLYDGRDIEDQLIEEITSLGITIVAAAGNDGPAPMTIGSPGTANTAITVAAAAHPVNTRVFWDVYYEWPGIGYYLYTSESPQIYAFSSRGPTSDGRVKPTVAATGIFVLSAYPPAGAGGLAWVSGTSMATPAVSGAVALLNSYAENKSLGASPQDYKEALVGGSVWLDGYTEYDQGAGYLDAYNALEALKADPEYGTLPPELPPEGELEDIANVPIVGSGSYTFSIVGLEPGHKIDFVFRATEATDSIMLNVSVTDLGVDPLLMNSFEVYIQSAKRTFYDYYVDTVNVYGNAWFLITDEETSWGGDTYGGFSLSHIIEPGYVKIVIENDWTSFDAISGNITITVTEGLPPFAPDDVFSGTVTQGDELTHEVSVPEWAGKTIIELWWTHNWSSYPTSDLDLIIVWDEGENFDGATFNSPERTVIYNPTTLTVVVVGYTIYTGTESFEARVYFYIIGDVDQNGKVDIIDLGIAALAYGSYSEHDRWNPEADINRDGKIDIIDLALIAKHFGMEK